ncbi:unnamed protein product [Knipowitschia caucasica]|uniref:Uncharacterized protein n=1 Tax=Knipowitschia caucasica TaxID=637954 RepID=A0AAV2KZH7_KNICA
MKNLAALVLLSVICSVSGSKCYLCGVTDSQPCTRTVECGFNQTRCFRSEVLGLVTQGCVMSSLCQTLLMSCCDGHLCNSSPFPSAPPPAVLMGLTAALFTVVF